MSYHATFYCPIQVTLIHDMTLEQFMGLDYYDNDDLPNPESPVASELLEVVATDIAGRQNEFRPLDGCGNIAPHFQLEKLSPVMHEGDVWLKVDCIAAETCDPGRWKDYVTEALDEMAIDAGFYEIGKDLCVVELCPYEYYNQTTCAAPPCKENKVLTESDFTELPAEHDNNNMHLSGDMYL